MLPRFWGVEDVKKLSSCLLAERNFMDGGIYQQSTVLRFVLFYNYACLGTQKQECFCHFTLENGTFFIEAFKKGRVKVVILTPAAV